MNANSIFGIVSATIRASIAGEVDQEWVLRRAVLADEREGVEDHTWRTDLALSIGLIPICRIVARDALVAIEVWVIGWALAGLSCGIVQLSTWAHFASGSVGVEYSVVRAGKARNTGGDGEFWRADETVSCSYIIVSASWAVVTSLGSVVEVAEGRTSKAGAIIKHGSLRWALTPV